VVADGGGRKREGEEEVDILLVGGGWGRGKGVEEKARDWLTADFKTGSPAGSHQSAAEKQAPSSLQPRPCLENVPQYSITVPALALAAGPRGETQAGTLPPQWAPLLRSSLTLSSPAKRPSRARSSSSFWRLSSVVQKIKAVPDPAKQLEARTNPSGTQYTGNPPVVAVCLL
jgi:hypothetical protein